MTSVLREREILDYEGGSYTAEVADCNNSSEEVDIRCLKLRIGNEKSRCISQARCEALSFNVAFGLAK